MAEHLQGQDAQVRVSRDGKLLACLRSVQSLEITLETQAQQLDHLGERAPRFEETFNGGSFRMSIRHTDSSYLTLMDSIQARAQHRTPGITFSIGCKLSYPNGSRVNVLIRDIAFDPINFNVAGRAEFVTSDLSGKFGELSKITGAGAL